MKLPKFGSVTNPTASVLKEIDIIGKSGFDYVEINIEEPLGFPEVLFKNKDEIRSLLKAHGMFAIAQAPWWAELGTLHEVVRKAWIKRMKEIIDISNKLGIKNLNLHSHARGMVLINQKTKKQVLDNYVLTLEQLLEYSRKNKIILTFENTAERLEITDYDDYKYIVDRVKEIPLVLDIGHALIHWRNKGIVKFIRTFGDRIETVHFHDNNGKRDQHKPIGTGILDYKRIVAELKKINFDRNVTIEVFPREKYSVTHSRDKLKRLWMK